MEFKLDHIGIATHELKQTIHRFEAIFDKKFSKPQYVPSQGITATFMENSRPSLELMEPTDPVNTIATFLNGKGTGVQHIAYEIADLSSAMELMKRKNIRLLTETPIAGTNGRKVVFIHPIETEGIVIELFENPGK